MNDETVRKAIRTYFEKALPGRQIKDEDDIFEKGFVNSLMAMQLVLFVEKEFEFSVTEEDLDLANFRSINAVADLVRRKSLQTL